jgi:L-ascorbate metabolism protein UlaG (beta-lactamase superfamily)
MFRYTSGFDGRIFHNPVPTEVTPSGALMKMLKAYMKRPKNHKPLKPLPRFRVDPQALNKIPEQGLQVTWLGHSTVLLDVDGKRFLTDPVWYKRVSPFTKLGPKRFYDVPVSLDALPEIDFILLSHNHYDHLDKNAIQYLTTKNIPVITQLKVGEQLQKWGVDPSLITELDWWETTEPAEGFTIRALPARHFSGRWLNDRFKTLWGSFAIRGPKHHVYFGADSGYYEGFAFIGKELGPFDLSLLDTGAYNELWESIHMGPENAVQANIDLQSKILMPIHWGTFSLALHQWTEPVERVMRAAEANGVQLLLPAPGETVEAKGEYISNWWKETV